MVPAATPGEQWPEGSSSLSKGLQKVTWSREQLGNCPIPKQGSRAWRNRDGELLPFSRGRTPAGPGTLLQGSRSCSRSLPISNPEPHDSPAGTKRSSLSWGIPLGRVMPLETSSQRRFIFVLWGPTTPGAEFSLQRSGKVGEGDTRGTSERECSFGNPTLSGQPEQDCSA